MTAASLTQPTPLLIGGHMTFANVSWDLYEDILARRRADAVHRVEAQG